MKQDTVTITKHYGTITIRRRVKTYHLDCSYSDLSGKSKRYRASLNTTLLPIARAKAEAMGQAEYSRRCAGIHSNKRITIVRFLEEQHFPYLQNQIGLQLTGRRGGIMSTEKAKTDTQCLRKWFLPFVKDKKWQYLETTKFTREFRQHLERIGMKRQTIKNSIGLVNRFLLQADEDGYISRLPIFPTIHKTGKSYGMPLDSYAVATDSMILELDKKLKKLSTSTTHKSRRRSYKLCYAWFRLLADSGIRPFTKPVFNWSHIGRESDSKIYLRRTEKRNEYKAQGGEVSVDALNELRLLYLSEGVNVEGNKNFPVLAKPDGTQLTYAHATLSSILKSLGWYDMTDSDNRKYRAYSIRKWHINKSIASGEDPHSIAIRVGHSYATLERYYLDRSNEQQAKADIWTQLTKDSTSVNTQTR